MVVKPDSCFTTSHSCSGIRSCCTPLRALRRVNFSVVPPTVADTCQRYGAGVPIVTPTVTAVAPVTCLSIAACGGAEVVSPDRWPHLVLPIR
jgi:hypothetical protein